MNVQKNIMGLLESHNIHYDIYEHGPILNYEDALREQKIHRWKGIESKSVFMNSKRGGYYLYVSVMGKNIDFKQMKELTGEKLSIASRDEVEVVALCTPGCVAPFGLSPEIITIVDEEIFESERYLFSPGISHITIALNPKDLRNIFSLNKRTLFI